MSPTLQYNRDAFNTVTDSNSPTAIAGLCETYLTIQQRCLQYSHRLQHSNIYIRATWGLPYTTTEMPSIQSPTQTLKQLYTGYVGPTLQYSRDAINTVTDSKSPTAIAGLCETYLTIQQRCLQYSHRLKHSNIYIRATWGLPYTTTEMPSIQSPTQTLQQLYTGYVGPTLQYSRDAINTVTDSNTPTAIDGLRTAYLTI